MRADYPSYLTAYKNGTLARLVEKTMGLLESCEICPRKCGVNRAINSKGFCKTGLKARVYNSMPHHGEEPPISGVRGSGTIFFAGCNLRCVYCQNYKFSQLEEGREVTAEELSDCMLKLQKSGCHNINLVTPMHVMPQILQALYRAIPEGLTLPLVFNTSGYELSSMLKLLEGIIDVYLADMRYADSESAEKFSAAPEYPFINRLAIKEMRRQAGPLKLNANKIAQKGLIIRHLVLPNNFSGTKKIMEFISREISPDSHISLMNQYYPAYNALKIPEIARRLSQKEYDSALAFMHECGLHNGWTQDSDGLEKFAGTNIVPNI